MAFDKQFVKCAGTLANRHINTLKYSGTPGVFNLQYLNDKESTAVKK
jgi:hypothetical protein